MSDIAESDDRRVILSRDTLVPVSVFLAMLTLGGAFYVRDSARVERDTERYVRLETKVDQIILESQAMKEQLSRDGRDRWSRAEHMAFDDKLHRKINGWISLLEVSNPTLKVPKFPE